MRNRTPTRNIAKDGKRGKDLVIGPTNGRMEITSYKSTLIAKFKILVELIVSRQTFY